ncbi:MAG: GWxTD domain-containing protein [Candidatus Aminicenantales bacterium]
MKIRYILLTIIFFLALLLFSCGPSIRVGLDPESLDFFETARLIMSKQERDIFTHLPDKESRDEFIEDFWEKRDPNPQTEENEFKEEFFRRIEYANQRFKEGMPGWKTDRGRIYLYFGDPDRIDEHPFVTQTDNLSGYPDVKGYIWWVYYRYGLAILFLDKKGNGSYTFEPTPAEYGGGIYGNIFEAMERAKFGLPIGGETSRKFMDFSLRFDRKKQEVLIGIPTKSLLFVEEEGKLKADFEFIFYLYEKGKAEKTKFAQTRHFESTEEEVLELKRVEFTFSLGELKPGTYYLDVVVIAQPDLGKSRKIFTIRV